MIFTLLSLNILIGEKKSIFLIFLTLLIFYLATLYLLVTFFHKRTIRENLKKYQTNYILGVIIISLSLLNLFQKMVSLIDIKDQSIIYLHGRPILEKNLYSCKSILNVPNFYYTEYDYKKKSKKGEYLELFNKEKVSKTRIIINQNNLDYLRYNAKDKPTVLIDSISINNYILNNVGLKTKGQTTLLSLIKTNNNLFSYTVKFKECINKNNGFKNNQNLLGLNKISFNNMFGDPTKVKEFLSYYLLTELQVPTPAYSYTTLTINNSYQGLYFMIEPIDKSLTMRTLKEKNDFLIKPDINGAELLYDHELDKYLEGEYDFDSIFKDKNGKLVLPKNNILEKYNGIWENDLETLEDIYNQLPMFFKWLKKLNELSNIKDKDSVYYKDELSKIIDIDSLIKYWAVNVFVVNSDSYISHVKQNYALYMSKSGKVTIIPWDYNYSFGGSIIRDTDSLINFDIYNPTINCKLEDRPLLNVILGNKSFREKYEQYLRDILIIASEGGVTSDNRKYPKDNLSKLIHKNRNLIINSEKTNTQSFYKTEDIIKAQDNLSTIINLRSKSVIRQLNNEKSNIHTNIELDTIGGHHSIMKNKWNRLY